MAVTLDLDRASYGRLLLPDADLRAVRFFAEDISSVDGQHPSFDERAATGGLRPQYDETDTTAIRRGMRLNRAPGRLWAWVREEAPVGFLDDLPPNLDLIDCTDQEFDDVAPTLHAALAGFVAPASGQWRRLAVATKIIHLKRPRLVPILDRNVLAVLGLHLPDDAAQAAQVSMGLEAARLIREVGRHNRAGLTDIEAQLKAAGNPRPPARILDALLWLAY